MLSDYIYVHHFDIANNILGPGKRLVIWMTGCPFRCKGCIEEALQELEFGDKYRLEEFFNLIFPVINKLKAVTFSGGEPLFQKNVLKKLLKLIPDDIDIMLYTGTTTDRFYNEYNDFCRYIDICVTEPFIQNLHKDHLWRASTNQKIISPSKKYDEKMLKTWMNSKSKGIEIHINKDNYFIYGIPVPGMLNQLDSILKKQGVKIF